MVFNVILQSCTSNPEHGLCETKFYYPIIEWLNSGGDRESARSYVIKKLKKSSPTVAQDANGDQIWPNLVAVSIETGRIFV